MKFNDLAKKMAYIRQWHGFVTVSERKKEAENKGYTALLPDLGKALNLCIKKHDRYYGNTSKHTPHQGKQECARRMQK